MSLRYNGDYTMKIKIHTIRTNIAKGSKKEVREWLIPINILTKTK